MKKVIRMAVAEEYARGRRAARDQEEDKGCEKFPI